MPAEPAEEQLTRGNASGDVVRVGDTVRKPWSPTTPLTVAYMDALRCRGIDLPAPRGRDERGRLVVDFVPGSLAIDDAPLGLELVGAVGALVRAIHDASVGLPTTGAWDVLIPADGADLLCHNDLATWNLVVDGDRLVFIDWDGAGPSTRLWDLAYAAISFAHLFPDADSEASAVRLAVFVDGYGADAELRASLPQTLVERAAAMHDLLRRSHETGREPWSTMYVEGHGEHWLATTQFIERNEHHWRRAVAPSVTP